MGDFEKHADFYRGYLADGRSLIPVTVFLATGIAFWLLIYLVSVVGPAPSAEEALQRHDAGVAFGLHAAAGTLDAR